MAYVRKRCSCPDQDKCKHSWYYTIDSGKDPRTGRRKQISKGGFKTAKDATREALKAEQMIERNQPVGAPKLANYLENFFEEQVKFQVATMTYYNQKHMADKFIIPKFGQVPMNKITPQQIESYFAELVRDNVHRGTIRNISLVLRKAFRQAQKWNVIHTNPMQFAKTPKYKAQTMKVWNRDQVKAFLAMDFDPTYHAIYHLALNSGMRCGEMLGIHRSDIDFEAGTVTIRRSIKYTLGEGLHEKDPKNANSMRTIDLPASTLEVLDKLIKNSIPSNYVFHTFGEPLYPSEVSRRFQADVKRSKLPQIRFHDMRHTHATLLLQLGVNPKVVAERLGHASIKTLLDTYTHVLPSMQKDVANRLNDLFTT